MEMFTQIFGGAIIFMLYSWRIITPYIFYRDVVSGSLTCDSVRYIITQGCISGGVGIYYLSSVGFRSIVDGIIIIAFLLMAFIAFYFGTKAWLWSKQNN